MFSNMQFDQVIYMLQWISVNIGPGKGLLTGGTKPLLEPILIIISRFLIHSSKGNCSAITHEYNHYKVLGIICSVENCLAIRASKTHVKFWANRQKYHNLFALRHRMVLWQFVLPDTKTALKIHTQNSSALVSGEIGSRVFAKWRGEGQGRQLLFLWKS